MRNNLLDKLGRMNSPKKMPSKKDAKISKILFEAEKQFAQHGYRGTSLDIIAAALNMSRNNLLYYFRNKDDLYQAVLDDILNSWLESMSDITHKDSPEKAIKQYVKTKLEFSRMCPTGSIVFTREIMAGAPNYKDKLSTYVIPRLMEDIEQFESWAKQGKIRHINYVHLMFMIWSSTQAYADLSSQYTVLLGKEKLTESDFDDAYETITDIILSSLLI